MKTKTNQKEKESRDIMSIQQRYHWLKGYYERTPEERERINRNIDRSIFGITKTTIIIFGIVLMSLISSCKKSFNSNTDPNGQGQIDDKRELIEITIGGIQTQIKDQAMDSKSYDPTIWVYQYSDQKFTLTFTNVYNTYTKSVSIQELKTGSITMKLYAGTYNITYNPTHNPLYSDKIDVSINMTNVAITGSGTINLVGVVQDGLFIVDVPASLMYPYPNAVLDPRGSPAQGYPTLFYNATNDFYYGYTNVRPVHPLTIYFADATFGSVDSPTFQCGRVYWISREGTSNVNLTFPDMIVERISQ